MTIGIAASGPGAGRAILDALAGVEPALWGAIGGFVSAVAIGADGRVHRACIQRGGARALLARDVAAPLLDAPLAGLMSSGPDRPEPLAQFVPAEGGVGLVTGHRFPHEPGADGVPLGEAALALMRAGASAREAVERTVALNPGADAGLIALGLDGAPHPGDTALARTLPDAGSAVVGRGGAQVAVLLNAIHPAAGLAAFVAQCVAERLAPPAVAGTLLLRRGTPVLDGPERSIRVDALGVVEAVLVPGAMVTPRPRSQGIGYRARVLRSGAAVGQLLDDPFLIVERGAVVSADGQEAVRLRYGGIEGSDPASRSESNSTMAEMPVARRSLGTSV